VTVAQSKCTLHCDCEHLERTCYVCRHILCLLKAMNGNSFGLADQTLSARLSKSLYWGIFHSGNKIPIDDAVPLHTVSRITFDAWISQQPEPSSVGVPTTGLIGGVDIDHDGGELEESGHHDGGGPKKKAGSKSCLQSRWAVCKKIITISWSAAKQTSTLPMLTCNSRRI
jgi:hypothetical protein